MDGGSLQRFRRAHILPSALSWLLSIWSRRPIGLQMTRKVALSDTLAKQQDQKSTFLQVTTIVIYYENAFCMGRPEEAREGGLFQFRAWKCCLPHKYVMVHCCYQEWKWLLQLRPWTHQERKARKSVDFSHYPCRVFPSWQNKARKVKLHADSALRQRLVLQETEGGKNAQWELLIHSDRDLQATCHLTALG